jgi:hypothetical protein
MSTRPKVLHWLKFLIATLICGFCLFPYNSFATAFHLDRLEILFPGSIGPIQAVAVALFTFAAWALYWRSFESEGIVRLLWTILGGYLLAITVSAVSDHSNPACVTTCTAVLASLSIGLACAFLCENARTSLVMISTLGVAISASAVYGYGHHSNVLVSGTIIRAGGPFDQPLELSNVLLLAIPPLIYFASKSAGAIESVAWFTGAGTATAAMLLAVSRGPIAACVASIVALYERPKRGCQTGAVLVMIFILSCAAVNFARGLGRANEGSISGSNAGREIVWRDGLLVFERHWLTGVGPGCLDMPIHAYYLGAVENEAAVYSSNLELQWLDELGIGGGILLSLFIYSIWTILYRSRDSIARPTSAVWLGLLFSGIFDVPFGTNVELGPTVIVGALLGSTLMLGYGPSDK